MFVQAPNPTFSLNLLITLYIEILVVQRTVYDKEKNVQNIRSNSTYIQHFTKALVIWGISFVRFKWVWASDRGLFHRDGFQC